MPICQTDLPLDRYQEEFRPYAEEYLALPDRLPTTVLPWMVCPGNHEVETDATHGETFRAYKARFAMPEAGPERDTTTVASWCWSSAS